MLFNFALVVFMSRRYVAWKFRFDTGYWKSFLRESLPMGVAGLVTFLYFKFDSILLSVLQNTEAVGIYNGAYKIIENLVFFPAMVIGLVFPLFSRHIFEEHHVFREYADKTFKVFSVLVVPLLIGTLFFAKDLVTLMGGDDFAKSAGVLRILIFALAAMFFGQWSNAILLAGNLQRKMLKILVVCAAVNVVANIVVIPVYSYYGAAVISVITEILVVAIGAFLLDKHLHYRPSLSKWWGILVSGAVMSLFFLATDDFLHFLVASALGIAIYFVCLLLFGSVKREEFSGIFVKDRA
jgi:O-antigen/teichoic acid export membrane protein